MYNYHVIISNKLEWIDLFSVLLSLKTVKYYFGGQHFKFVNLLLFIIIFIIENVFSFSFVRKIINWSVFKNKNTGSYNSLIHTKSFPYSLI